MPSSVIILAVTQIYFSLLAFSLHFDKVNATVLHYRVDYRRGYLVNLGDTINLTCPYSASFYKWTPATQTSWILSEDQIFSLKADTLGASGKYICSAVNGFGHNAAEFNIKVIDKYSPTLEQSCALLSNGRVSESGPCYLNTYSEEELSQQKAWGEDVSLDCESVVVEGLAERVAYTWSFQPLSPTKVNPHPDTTVAFHPIFYASTTVGERERSLRMTTMKEGSELSSMEAVARFTGSTLRIRKITLAHAGEYHCSVHVDAKIDDPSGALGVGRLSRTFRIRVQPRSEGDIIQGPHNVTATIEIGRDATFSCEINEEEHRSATIRWGKYISLDESSSTNFRKKEVLHWSGGTYVVLPTILSQDLQQFFDIPKALAVSNPGSRRSRLVLRSASPHDAGLYICSAITESGRDDHKFVRISIKDGDRIIEDLGDFQETTPQHLTIYIVVPICIFLVCFCTVASLIIRNHSCQNQRLHHQNGQKSLVVSQSMGILAEKPSLNSSHRCLNRSSIAGSASMTFTRSGSPQLQGKSSVSSRLPPAIHLHMHPSSMNSTINITTSQLQQSSKLPPRHVQPTSNFYPSLNTECVCLTEGGVLTRPPCVPSPIPTYGPPAYMNGLMPKSDFQRYSQVKGVSHNGYPPSGNSSACTTGMGSDHQLGSASQCGPTSGQ